MSTGITNVTAAPLKRLPPPPDLVLGVDRRLLTLLASTLILAAGRFADAALDLPALTALAIAGSVALEWALLGPGKRFLALLPAAALVAVGRYLDWYFTAETLRTLSEQTGGGAL